MNCVRDYGLMGDVQWYQDLPHISVHDYLGSLGLWCVFSIFARRMSVISHSRSHRILNSAGSISVLRVTSIMIYKPAVAERLPSPIAPPIMTTCSRPSIRSGYTLRKSAAFVNGPQVTRDTLLPLPFCHVCRTARAIASIALTVLVSSLGKNRACTSGWSDEGSPSTPPRPSTPWIWGSCLMGRRRGLDAPA